MKYLVIACSILMLGACTTLPPNISNAPQPNLALQQVIRGGVDKQIASNVRWGGRIIKVENDNEGSTLHVLEFPLNHYGLPEPGDKSAGRFLVYTHQFLDPEIYSVGSMVTVFGQINAKKTIKVDKKTMQLPVVNLGEIHIWKDTDYYSADYYYPMYGPYGYGPYGYPYPIRGGFYGRRGGYYW